MQQYIPTMTFIVERSGCHAPPAPLGTSHSHLGRESREKNDRTKERAFIRKTGWNSSRY